MGEPVEVGDAEDVVEFCVATSPTLVLVVLMTTDACREAAVVAETDRLEEKTDVPAALLLAAVVASASTESTFEEVRPLTAEAIEVAMALLPMFVGSVTGASVPSCPAKT
jgi:hypothetical protein